MMPSTGEPIAIVGSACRFPGGASSPSKLWELLKEPRDVLREFPKDRLNLGAFYHPDGEHHGTTDVCNKGYLLEEDTRLFDAAFFNLNPAEADDMDPQQRIALETVYESLEAAGYTLEQMQGSQTAVFLGVMTEDYHEIQHRDPETINRYNATGNAKSILSNRVSYYFDLHGPSVTIDTACSSSLAAVHLAVQSLRNGESSAAIAVGVNLIFDPAGYIGESKLHMLSPTSRSRMWDAGADGYARGEGAASIVLKPLSQALRDGDHIESIIRETGMNSDGRTTGITMPSSTAQSALIRQTYQNAGLDPIADRPQYFEAHGTGTLAGDPVEAKAIRESFFPKSSKDANKLYCGSIKTVIGHLEGCAGLAGLLKASLALQNGLIPPNLLFNKLNPAIEPFYDLLQVPTVPIPWPSIPAGHARRASVNSFGFGGTNCHAILESYNPDAGTNAETRTTTGFVGPLVLSAEKESSLAQTVREYAEYIRANPGPNLEDVAFVTQTRRSIFPTRASFSGNTREKLLETLDTAIETSKSSPIGIRGTSTNSSEPPAILGIFTGQGAQWASMGRMLIEGSSLFRESIQKCAEALRDIPDAPSWSLVEELTAPEVRSRIGEAALSQPLCTAVQIALTDLLAASGIQFDAVVGHSSGEIGATYAAGILSATDAMRIAYYRGFHAKLASGPSGKHGLMIAVGLGSEEAISFCEQPKFQGRISLAASNSPTSVTLSGDADAILEAKQIFDEQRTFARLLKVDTAYHSHHMLSCAASYLESLRTCNIQVNTPSPNCVWVSSVYGNAELVDDEEDLETLAGQYWVDNMVRPVLFSEAVECALWRAGPFQLGLEIGPHPALKGPASQTIKTALGQGIPYGAFLRREGDDLEAFLEGVGFVWTHLGSLVNFSAYRQAIHGPDSLLTAKVVKGLPSYPWNHEKIHWREARISRRYRLADHAPHELLGRRMADDSDVEMRWRNILKLSELPWLRGHAFQGAVLFPTSAYMAMAIQAAMEVARGRGTSVRLIEVTNLEMPRGLTVEEHGSGAEIIFSMKRMDNGLHDDVYQADFTIHGASGAGITATLERNCTGSISIDFGEPSADTLPPRAPPKSDLTSIDAESYYASFLNIGLNFQGPFRGLKSVQRSMGYASCKAAWNKEDVGDKYVIHPGPLDAAFHSIISAFCTPLSGALWAPYLPVKVDRLAVVPNIHYGDDPDRLEFEVDTFITKATSNAFEGDVHIISPDGRTALQAEGLTLKLFTEAHPSDDRALFSKTVWKPDILGSASNLPERNPDREELALFEAIERTSLHYIKELFDHLTDADVEGWRWYHKVFYHAAKACLQEARDGTHPAALKEWLDDPKELILQYKEKYPEQADLKLIHAVAQALPGVMNGDVQLLEHMLVDNMLSNLYTYGRGLRPLNRRVGELMENLTHRYPRLSILEIGAGTGGTTESILRKIGDTFGRYTYTDVSAGFFENAKKRFVGHDNLQFKTLDIESDPLAQGFEPEGQDVIVASNVLHATRSLRESMTNVRKLLKPGGYLIMVEVTGYSSQMMLAFGGLPGWWLGADEGRTRGPGVDLTEWDNILRDTGFTGVDKYVSDLPDARKHSCSVVITQAADERLSMLQDPLSFLDEIPLEPRLLIVGGKTLTTSRTVKAIERLASRFADQVSVVDSIDALSDKHTIADTSVICLSDIEKPLFSEPITPARLAKLQSIFSCATNTLWLTSGRVEKDAYANMTVGLGRALINELPQLKLQFLDVPTKSSLDARLVVEAFLKLKLSSSHEFTTKPVLWSSEPEIILQDDSTVLIPRVVPDKERNDRLNASRRKITKEVGLSKADVTLSSTEQHGLALVEDTPWFRRIPKSQDPILRVQHSISLPFCANPRVLSLAKPQDGSQSLLSLAPEHGSVLYAPRNDLFTIPQGDIQPHLLLQVAAQITSLLLLSTISTLNITAARSLLVYGARPELLQALRALAESSKLFVFATSQKGNDEPADSIYLHPKASVRAIHNSLPSSITHVVDLSGQSAVGETVGSRLSNIYQVVKFSTDKALGVASDLAGLLSRAYQAAVSSAQGSKSDLEATIAEVQDLLSLQPSVASYPTIVDWTSDRPAAVTITPISGKGMFSPDKTYLMVGLVSGLGRSICRWMAENGAKYFVLTSRSAQVDQLWLREMEKLGAVVKVCKMDVSKRESVRSVCETIKKELPPVGGVCNGALVLNDGLFLDMEADAGLNDVFAPKVAGTLHLDEMFSEPTLDFFILFSSMSAVVGNAGQSNYNAASLFQAAIANQRRSKGLAASLISLGMVSDVGYAARRGASLVEKLKNMSFLAISEAETHVIFAETVAASKASKDKASQDDTVEIATGIKHFTYNSSTKALPQWFSNPRCGHLIRRVDEDDSGKSSNLNGLGSVSVLEKMAGAGSEDEAAAALLAGFSAKLESMLQMTPGSHNVDGPLIDAGIDSLLAVEIRTWFLREVHVDVPVLKILSGESSKNICAEVASKHLAAKSDAGAEEGVGATTSDATAPITNSDTASTETSSNSAGGESSDVTATSKSGTMTPQSSRVDDDSVLDSLSEKAEVAMAKPEKEKEVIRTEKLSFAQSRLWFLSQFSKDPFVHNSVCVYKVTGNVQIPRLRRALTTVIAHNDALRTSFTVLPGSGEPVQRLLHASSLSDPLLCIRNPDPSDKQATIDREIDVWRKHEWRLEDGELLKVIMITHGPEDHSLLIAFHHIAMDGVGMHFFLSHLNAVYSGSASSLPKPPKGCYMDLSVRERHAVESGQMDSQISYWIKQHSPPPVPIPLLPFARLKSRPVMDDGTYKNSEAVISVDADLTERIKRSAQSLRVTSFHFWLAALRTLLCRLAASEEVCIGVSDANRSTLEGSEQAVGFFMNLLPLRFRSQQHAGEETFSAVAQSTKAVHDEARMHGRAGVPLDVVLERLSGVNGEGGLERDVTCTPLFQVAMNFRLGKFSGIKLGPNCVLEVEKAVDSRSPYDLAVSVTVLEEGKGSAVQVVGREEIYGAEEVKMFGGMLVKLLEEVTRDAGQRRVSHYGIFEEEEVKRGLELGNGPGVTWGALVNGWEGKRTLTELVEGVRDKRRIAIKDEDGKSFTYAELMEKVDRVACWLVACGVMPRSRVAVLCEPTSTWVVAMLATLKIGAVYLPLDTKLPDERLGVILNACGPELSTIVCDGKTLDRGQKLQLDTGGAWLENLDDAPTTGLGMSSSNLESPEEAAFILFTSGSTGVPKGIELSSAGIINYLASKGSRLSLGADDVVLQQSALGFDMAIAQAFNALAHGGTLVVASKDSRGDPVVLGKLMAEHNITFTLATPTEYLMLLRHGADTLRTGVGKWRNACSGGEAISRQLKDAFLTLRMPPTLTDCYGPTEISCCATMRTVELGSSSEDRDYGSVVGTANPNTAIYIIDEAGDPLPPRVPGEICVGGVGVACGYIDDKLSREKFVDNPFASSDWVERGWRTMYKTGDKGVLCGPDGVLRFLGRLDGDTTVKVRGMRIDLDDVAHSILKSHGGISDAVVTIRGDPAFIVAHAVLATGADVDLIRLIERLPLPHYMKPSRIIALDRLPMSSNGKVDRKAIAALPLPASYPSTVSAPAPSSTSETKKHRPATLAEGELRLLWDSVLRQTANAGVHQITPETDFFHVGGTSLLLVTLQGAIKASIGVTVSIKDMYQSSTLGAMAALIAQRKESKHTQPDIIKWDAETALPPSLDLSISPSSQIKHATSAKGLQILMTGSTGFLGGAILTSLLSNPSVQHVHCVAVDHPQPSTNPRVTFYAGNLAEHYPTIFGLPTATYDMLRSTVDVIILAGAQGHCLNSYSTLRASNVESTKQVAIKFALPRRIPIHYVSSNRVTLLDPTAEELGLPPVSVRSHTPAEDGSEGFTASKWACEVFLENLSGAVNGLPITIHRPCAVVGESAPAEDALNALLRYSRLLRAVPWVGSLNFGGYFDFGKVEEVAGEIVREVFGQTPREGEEEQQEGVRYRHYSSGVRVTPGEFAGYMERVYGGEFRDIGLDEWIEGARREGIEELIVSYLLAVVERGGRVVFPFMGNSQE